MDDSNFALEQVEVDDAIASDPSLLDAMTMEDMINADADTLQAGPTEEVTSANAMVTDVNDAMEALPALLNPVVPMPDNNPAQTALINFALDKIRDNQPLTHADAWQLLTWRDHDPRIQMIPTVHEYRIPQEGGAFFLLERAGTGTKRRAGTFAFQANGGPSIKGREELYEVNGIGVLRHSCGLKSGEAHPGFNELARFVRVKLPTHAEFPLELQRGWLSRCIEAKQPSTRGDFMYLEPKETRVYLVQGIAVDNAGASSTEIAIPDGEDGDAGGASGGGGGDLSAQFSHLHVTDTLMVLDVNILEMINRLQQQVNAMGGGSRHSSPNADFAEWFRRREGCGPMEPGMVVEIRDDQVSLETTFMPGSIFSIVSADPAFIGNAPADQETREASEMIMMHGRGPVRVSGPAPANAFLVPSGKMDGTARAVTASEMAAQPELERQVFGVVMSGGSEGDEAAGTTVWAFVSAKPFFGGLPDLRMLVQRVASPRQQPYPYQLACVDRAKEENVIVNLGTGLGKTLIAVHIFDHFASLDPSKLTLFVVPKVAIVEQQADVVRLQSERCGVRVSTLSGMKMDPWGATEWTRCVEDADMLLGTPEVFRRAFDRGFLKLEAFGLWIIDECHNATGNSPMASLMRDTYQPALIEDKARPRILGLTASFEAGRLGALDQKRASLETLLDAVLFSPPVPEVAEREKAYEIVRFERGDSASFEEIARAKVEQLLSNFENAFPKFPIKEPHKVIDHSVHALEELGASAFYIHLRDCIVVQLEVHAEKLVALGGSVLDPSVAAAKAQQVKDALPELRAEMRRRVDEMRERDELTRAPKVSDKCSVLLSTLESLFSAASQEKETFKGLVFVEQIALTVPLEQIINAHPFRGCQVRALACSGGGSMSEAVRSKAVRDFRDGTANVLVCTAALDEGLDVSDAAFVVSFSKTQTTKSYIQRAGRARKDGARILLFENDPTREAEGVAQMQAVARDDSLALTEGERQRRIVDEAEVEIPNVYPWPCEGGAKITLYNAKQVVGEYCQKVLAQPLKLDQLIDVQAERVREYDPIDRKLIASVRYPSPKGEVRVTRAQVEFHWDGHEECCFNSARTRGWSTADKEEASFLYVTAVDMHRRGYLTDSLEPSPAALAPKTANQAVLLPSHVTIQNRFPPEPNAPPAASSAPTPGGGSSTGAPTSAPTSRPPLPSDATSGTVDLSSLSAALPPITPSPSVALPPIEPNWKGLLNERFPPESKAVSYASRETTAHHFVATVTVNGVPYEGVVTRGKKEAEKAAAKAAAIALKLITPTDESWVVV